MAYIDSSQWHRAGCPSPQNRTKAHWRGLADVVDRYVRKGTQLYIEGRLRTREWTDKDGNKRYTTEILADTMNLLGRRSDNPASDGTSAGGASYGGASGGSSFGGGQQAPTYGGGQNASFGGGQTRPAASSAYGQSAPAYGQPAAPSVPADDPDDLPF